MIEQGKTVSRQELYEAVWRTPVSKLAPEWGVRGAAIIKACDEMGVPRPGVGHWTMVQRGWEMERPPLAQAGAGVATCASLIGTSGGGLKGARSPAELEVPERPRRSVEIPKNFENAHPFVKQTRQALTTDTFLDKGVVFTHSHLEDRLHPSVSPEQLDRALLIYDVLIKHAIELGGRFVAGPERRRLELFMGKQAVHFQMKEAMRRLPLNIAGERKQPKGYFPWKRHEWAGTGVLRFEMYGEDLRERVWRESKRAPLEDQVGEIIEALAGVEEEAKAVREDRESSKRKSEEEWGRQQEARRHEEERRNEIERALREEEENRNRLVEMAQNWREAKLVRRFLRACGYMSTGKASGPDGWFERWTTWARAHADRLDPMTNGYLKGERKRFGGEAAEGSAK